MKHSPAHSLRFGLILFTLLTCGPVLLVKDVTAQPTWYDKQPEMFATLEDGSHWLRIDAHHDTLPAEWFSAGYQFRMSTDSTSVTDYTFTGCKRNGMRVPLQHWKDRRAVNFPADILAYNSRTEVLTLDEGDTLSFYRELSWMDPRSFSQALNNYRSLDTLTFAVELVRCSDSSHVVLLDSIGVMPCGQQAMCSPTIYGTRPIMAHVFWIAPASLAGTPVFVRVRPLAMGQGEFYFTRVEQMSVALWRRLLDPYWTTYLSQWNAFQKSIPLGSGMMPNSADIKLLTRVSTVDHNTVSVDFNAAPNEGAVALMVFDINGNHVFTPFARSESSGTYSISYRFAESGAYVIALAYDGAIVRSEKVTITK